MRSFVVSTTSAGRSSYRTAGNPLGKLTAQASRFILPGRNGAATRPAPRPAPGSRSCASSPAENDPVSSVSHPITYGPTNPPVVPMELMNARPPAAAMPVRNRGGMVQKIARAPLMPVTATAIPRPTPRSCPANRIAPRKPQADKHTRERQVDDLAAAAVDMAGPQDHPDHRHDIAATADKADLDVGELAFTQDQRQEDADAVRADQESELREREDDDAHIADGRPPGGGPPADALGLPAARGRCGVSSSVSQDTSSGRSARIHSRLIPMNTTGSPSMRKSHCQPGDARHAVQAQQPTRHRPADDGRDRDRHHEPRDHARAVLRRETRFRGRTPHPGKSQLQRRPAAAGVHRSCGTRRPSAVAAETSPHEIMMRDSHTRAPTR